MTVQEHTPIVAELDAHARMTILVRRALRFPLRLPDLAMPRQPRKNIVDGFAHKLIPSTARANRWSRFINSPQANDRLPPSHDLGLHRQQPHNLRVVEERPAKLKRIEQRLLDVIHVTPHMVGWI